MDSVLLDTSYLLALLDVKHARHVLAQGYLRYFLQQGTRLYASTITLAELGELHPVQRLPVLAYLRLLAFNLPDAQQAADLAARWYGTADRAPDSQPGRYLPDQFKILAQAATSGVHSLLADDDILLEQLAQTLWDRRPPFRCLPLSRPHEAAFGLTGTLF